MTDLKYLLEAILLLAIPVAPVAVGAYLRVRFPAGAPEATGRQKAARLAGNILFWGGLAAVLFVLAMALHFKGKFM